MDYNAHLTKRNGATNEIISERNTILRFSEILEAVLTLWGFHELTFEDGGAAVIKVWNKVEDRKDGACPVYVFELTNF